MGFFIVFFFFYFPCIVYFNLCYLFVLFFVGFYLPTRMWFDIEEEIDVGGRPLAPLWLSVVLALQLSLYSGGCFTRIELFMKFLCILHRFVRPWNKPDLLMILFELLVITIASCSVFLDQIQNLFLYFYCILPFGLCC